MKKQSLMMIASLLVVCAFGCTSTYERRTASGRTFATSGPGGSTTYVDERGQLYAPDSPIYSCIRLRMSAVPNNPRDPRYSSELKLAIETCLAESRGGAGLGRTGVVYATIPGGIENPPQQIVILQSSSVGQVMPGAMPSTENPPAGTDGDALEALARDQAEFQQQVCRLIKCGNKP